MQRCKRRGIRLGEIGIRDSGFGTRGSSTAGSSGTGLRAPAAKAQGWVPRSPPFPIPDPRSPIPDPRSPAVSYRGACRSSPVHSAGAPSKAVPSTVRTAICVSRAPPVALRRRCAVRRPQLRVSLVGRAVRGHAPRPPPVMLPRSSARPVLIPSPDRTSGAGGVSGR
jgi:hypothetical protein